MCRASFSRTCRYLSASSLFVDIGANRGQSINALRTIFPGCRIVAFEPNPAPFRQAAAALGGGNGSEIHNIAIGHENGTLSLKTPSCLGVIFDQNASVEDLNREDLAKFLQEFGYTFVQPSNIDFIETTIAVRPLDDFGLEPDFIKIVPTAKTLADNVTLMRFLEKMDDHTNIIGICMGDAGIISRVLGVRAGSAFTFAARGSAICLMRTTRSMKLFSSPSISRSRKRVVPGV